MSQSIFISWSGPVAGEISELLKTLVEDALGTGDVFLSRQIEGGVRWAHEIPRQLDECADGLVIVTSENHTAPWLHFEAGAISKHVDASHVTPLLFDADMGDIQGTPLALFQAKRLAKVDLEKLMIEMGTRREKDEAGVRRRFNHAWTDFENEISGIQTTAKKARKRLNNDDLGAMIESLAAQISRVTNPENATAAAIFGQSRLATASEAEAAEILRPYLFSGHSSSAGLFGSGKIKRNALASYKSEELSEEAKVAIRKWLLASRGEDTNADEKPKGGDSD